MQRNSPSVRTVLTGLVAAATAAVLAPATRRHSLGPRRPRKDAAPSRSGAPGLRRRHVACRW